MHPLAGMGNWKNTPMTNCLAPPSAVGVPSGNSWIHHWDQINLHVNLSKNCISLFCEREITYV